MAEGLGRKILKNFNVSSAGTNPENVNINAINSMMEIGIDISNYKSKKISIEKINNFDLVITLCGDAKDKCPIINSKKHIHWPIKDPSKFKGNHSQIMIGFSKVRDLIERKIIYLNENINFN